MIMRRETLRLRAALVTLTMTFGMAALMASGRFGAVTLARASSPSSLPAVTECVGDACSQVTVTFDEAKQQYRAHNNSTDRWVKVSASNLAASARACLAPGKEQYLSLKSVVGSYSAEFAEPKCGEAMD
jgi:hypothetical protein